MNKLTDIQMAKRKMAMRVRARLRLKAAEQYLDDLDAILPALEHKFDQATLEGKKLPPIVAFPEILKGEGEDA